MAYAFAKGLHDIGSGHHVWLQPNGSWGYSNAGLILDGKESLPVDTLFDERLTGEMLGAMQRATGIGGKEITTLVNTHANGDHTFGNRLVENAEIIASEASAREMGEQPPAMLANLVKQAPHMGEVGEYFLHCFQDFDFGGVTLRPPTKTFAGRINLKVGDKEVHLIEVGPAHTEGDVIVHVPADRVVYTGDIVFNEGTPIMWAGPVSNWLKACDLIQALDVEVVVPGHGPITDKAGVRKMQGYLAYTDREARKRFDAGMNAEEAALDIALGEYRGWLDFERIAVTVDSIWRDHVHSHARPNAAQLFGLMAKIWKDRRRGARI
jgi:glyoxylase-like metal-dependent hydrolase (beta-lactamase superfamily II)